MRSLLTAGLMAGIALASPAPRPQDKAYDASTVLATVNGTEITLGHVIALRDQLPPQYQNLPDDVLMTGLVDQLVDQELLAEAQSASPDSDPLAVKLTSTTSGAARWPALAANAAVADAVDEAKVQAAYDKQIAAFQPAAGVQRRAHPGRQRGQGQGAQGRDRRRQGLRRGRQGELQRRLGRQRRRPRLVRARADGAGVRGGGDGDGGRRRSPSRSRRQFGWHLIKLNEKRETAPPALDEARPEIENQLRQAALQAQARRAPRRARRSSGRTPALPPAAIRESDLLTN